MSIKNTLKDLLSQCIDIPLEDIKIRLENNTNEIYYTSNIILILEEKLNQNSDIIYKTIKNNIKSNEIIEDLDLLENKLLKITIKKDYLIKNLNKILEKNAEYGKNNIGNNQSINIELFINNFEIENYIKTIINIDNISRIMEFSGYNIEKEIYINDVNYIQLEEKIKEKLDNYRIYIEKYSNNKNLEEEYLIEDVLNKIRYSANCYIEENNIIIKNIDEESKEKYILIDNQGNYTDFSKYIAHIYEKYKNNYDNIIIYTDNNENYIINLKEEIKYLNNNNNNLNIKKIENNSIIKNETNMNKIRYMYLMNNYNFEELAKNYYKVITISSKLEKIIKKINNKLDQYNNINNNITYNILYKLIDFEDLIITTCQYKEPILLMNYASELINLLNIIIESNSFNNKNIINLLNASKIIINNILRLTGLIPEDEI